MRIKPIYVVNTLAVIAACSMFVFNFIKAPTVPGASIQKKVTTDIAGLGNPLLTASKMQLSSWTSRGHCGAELYMDKASFGGALVTGCIQTVIEDVEKATGVRLSPEDVINPAVKSHWLQAINER